MLRFRHLRKINSIVSLSFVKKVFNFLNHYVIKLFKRMDENNLFFSGAGIAFSLILGMIPLILLIFFLLGNIVDAAIIETHINNFIDQIIPYPAYANYMKRVISSRLPEVIEYKTLAGFIGVFGLLFTSTWIFSSIRTILNQIFSVKIQRGFFYGLIRDIFMVILLVLLITIYIFVIPAFNIIYELTKNYGFVQEYTKSPLWNLIVYSSSILLMFGLFFALYYLIPYEELGKRVAAVSAFWTTLLWEIARSIFGYYVNHVLGINPIYGAFVLILAILFWIFYSSCLFIVGAEIGQLYRERREQKLIMKK